MGRVMISPADFSISNDDYGKTYNILDNLQSTTLNVDAYISRCDTPVTNDSVSVHELRRESKLRYYTDAFRIAARELRNGNVDVYHHMNLSYRWFNPLLLAGLHGETPVVLGPCQTGHAIMAAEFNLIVNNGLAMDIDRKITDPVYRAIDRVRDFLVDPIRLKSFERTLRAADRIVVVHEDAKEFYANFVDESKLVVIPLGVDPTEFEFSERTESSSLVAIGRLKERKGYDILIDAMATVSEHYSDVHLHVFGEGPLEGQLKAQTENCSVEDNVIFHGHVDQSTLREYLADARAFVHPSRSESFSLVRLEAMSTGCPVVVTDTSGTTEMVREGQDGFIVSRGSPDPLAERILDLLSNFDLAKEMGLNARRRVEQKYDWRHIGQRYIDVYNELL